MRYKYDNAAIIAACGKYERLSEAAEAMGIPYKTFRRKAQQLGCFKTNQGLRGISRGPSTKAFDLADIFAGKHPHYSTAKLRKKLIAAGLKQNKCEICEIDSWCDKPLTCQLDHINGRNSDHRLENLRMLCPNCHSQTPTFGNKKRD